MWGNLPDISILQGESRHYCTVVIPVVISSIVPLHPAVTVGLPGKRGVEVASYLVHHLEHILEWINVWQDSLKVVFGPSKRPVGLWVLMLCCVVVSLLQVLGPCLEFKQLEFHQEVCHHLLFSLLSTFLSLALLLLSSFSLCSCFSTNWVTLVMRKSNSNSIFRDRDRESSERVCLCLFILVWDSLAAWVTTQRSHTDSHSVSVLLMQ